VLLALSRLAVAERGVAAVDVNPLVVVDGRPIAVDALVELHR
jgi:acetyl-CoA synthetase (ADP-forming)